MTLALQEGRRFLCEGQPRLAIPAALEALKMLTEIHGSSHTKLTPAYLIMAEAAIGTVGHPIVIVIAFLACDEC